MTSSSIVALNRSVGGSNTSLGVTRTACQLFGFLVGLVIGPIMDTAGRRTVILAVCTLAVVSQTCFASLSAGVFGVSPTGVGVGAAGGEDAAPFLVLFGHPLTAASMFTAGLVVGGCGLHGMTASKTILADTHAAAELPGQVGTLNMCAALSFVAGPVFFLLLKAAGMERFVFISAGGCAVVALLMTLRVVETRGLAKRTAAGEKAAGVKAVRVDAAGNGVSHRQLGVAFCTCLCACFPFSCMMQALDMYMSSKFAMGAAGISGTAVFVAVNYAASQGAVFPKVHARVGSRGVVVGAATVLTIATSVVDSCDPRTMGSMAIYAWLGVMAFAVASMAMLQSTTDVWMVELTNPSRGSALASMVSCCNNIATPFAAGVIIDAGIPLFRVTACVVGVGVLLAALFAPSKSSTKALL